MFKKILKNLVLIVSVAVVFNGCSKDDNDSSSLSSNPTNGKTTAVFNSKVTYGTMTDQDGNVYKTVTIGTQTWMAENLRTTKYNDGTAIPNVTDGDEWSNLSTGAYCNYDNTTNIVTIATYGRLYNWYAINTEKLAPEGWHVPSYDEWAVLISYLGGEYIAAKKLKEAGTSHWIDPYDEATNQTGFTALPGGHRDYSDGTFHYLGYYGNWWSATEENTDLAWYRWDFNRSFSSKGVGYSVRCVKD